MKPEELEYGVIYVFTNLYAPTQLLNDYIASAGRACGQAETLQRFKVEVVYVDMPPTLVARRFNAGNIGKAAVVSFFCIKKPVCVAQRFNMIDFSYFFIAF